MYNDCFKTFELVVFYHSEEELKKRINIDNLSHTNLINLNNFDLPDILKIKGLTSKVNKALFSEYLGIMCYENTSEYIGCFPYSIQNKFSYAWSQESGNKRFLPPIRFDELEKIQYDSNYLYLCEEKNIFNNVPKEMREIVNKFFPKYKDRKIILGPYKGSFIIPNNIFKKTNSPITLIE